VEAVADGTSTMTDWENRYQTGDMPWEKGQASPPLLELLGRPVAWGKGPVLVPGCGYGHDVRALGELGIPVVGVDISPTAVERAREFARTGMETYELGDFLDPEWRVGREFSAIWEHTCFCAIDPVDRKRYAEAAAGCLAVGGLLAGVFFLTPFDPHEEAVGPPFGVSVEELDAWFSPWFERLEGWVPQAAYPGRAGREWIGLFRKVAKA
jgi:SAM-dependent methyltransferase